MQESYQLLEKIQPNNGPQAILDFATHILGLPGLQIGEEYEHEGQIEWVLGSTKVINYLKPANQWGKTAITAVKHIYHAVTKPLLYGRVMDVDTWKGFRYETVNFGKTYEVARGVLESIEDIVEGRFLLPTGKSNESLLKGWAIKSIQDSSSKPPEIHWWNGSNTLIRSYDDLGSAFKRKRLAYVSGDECGDIPELRLFTTGTLVPRVSFLKGSIDLIGTPQPKGIEYEEMGEEAKKEMEELGEESNQFFYTGSVYQNPFLNDGFIKRLEAVADPELRRQIIWGEYVDWSSHFFTFDEVSNMFVSDIDWNEDTGISEYPDPNGWYVFSVDLAAAQDETAATCIRYNQVKTLPSGQKEEEPYKIVFHKGFVGNTIPLSMQYELLMSWYRTYSSVSPHCKFVFDGNSLGGKNAKEAFQALNPISFPPSGTHIAQAKAEAFGAFKEIVGRNRRVTKDGRGRLVDHVPSWGFLKASDKLRKLRKQMEAYSLDDRKLKQDRVVTVAQAVHYIEKRKPNLSRTKAMAFDLAKIL